MIYDGAVSVQGGTGWYFVVLGQYRSGLVDIVWCFAEQGSIGWYSMVLGQWKVVLVGTGWYWVITGWYWLKHYGTGSV